MNETTTVCDFCGEDVLFNEAYAHLDDCSHPVRDPDDVLIAEEDRGFAKMQYPIQVLETHLNMREAELMIREKKKYYSDHDSLMKSELKIKIGELKRAISIIKGYKAGDQIPELVGSHCNFCANSWDCDCK